MTKKLIVALLIVIIIVAFVNNKKIWDALGSRFGQTTFDSN